MIKTLLMTLGLCWVLGGCAVKDKPTQSPQPVADPAGLPEHVAWSEWHTYLVHSSLGGEDFRVGEMTAVYRIALPDLTRVAEAGLAVEYSMPEMPEMPVVPARIEKVAPGEFRVNYDISMGGVWALKLVISSPGKPDEALEYPPFTVPEE